MGEIKLNDMAKINETNQTAKHTPGVFKIKAIYDNGFSLETINGKDLGDAFNKFYNSEARKFRTVTGFELQAITKATGGNTL